MKIKELNNFRFVDEEVRGLYHALTGSDRRFYEITRNDLIWKYGYDEFREMQKKAFELIFKKG
jgi:hypothetical protein